MQNPTATPSSRSQHEQIPGDMSASEWKARVELAALYRLVALYEWDDLIYTHISARVPGSEDHFLINPFGLLFEQITASSLVKIDTEGNIVEDKPAQINRAGFVIHSAIHAARPDAQFVMHIHSPATIAVSAQKRGLLPISQHALVVLPLLAYHDYEGIAFNIDERERIVADLGDRALLLLRNHGSLAIGPDAAECWTRMHFLQRACEVQLMALTAGIENVHLLDDAFAEEVRQQSQAGLGGAVGWSSCLNRLAALSPGYDS